jgi:hypothetical protein
VPLVNWFIGMADQISNFLHWGIAGLLLVALTAFVGWYMWPGIRLGNELRRASKALKDLKSQGPVLDLETVAAEAMVAPSLKHCWGEYQDTLHPQHGLSATGSREVVRWRATAMASSFFHDAPLIDMRLHTEFFKNLPGILTGLGIIGTFSGLILGLQGFQVSDDAATVRNSLQGLLQAVGGAFMVSAAAIALAMLVTFVEKIIVSRRQGDVERLVGLIDSLFDSGAGEEYLQRLVESSENSATQAQQIKDALVSDLKSILTELTQAQIAAASNSHAQLAQNLSDSIKDGLKDPLERISLAVEGVSGHQGEAVNKLMTDVLASFSQQMQDMFGGQLRGMNDVLAETAKSIQMASAKFDTLAAQLQTAGNDAAEAMANRMESLMESLSARQAAWDAKMDEFLSSVQKSVQEGQSQSAEMMMGTFAELSKTTSDLVSQLRTQAERASQDSAQRVELITTRTTESIGKQGEQVATLVAAVEQATSAMRETTERAVSGVNNSVERLATGADRLHGASLKLEGSLNAMSEAADAVDGGIDELRGAATDMSAAAKATAQTLRDQQGVREAIGNMVTELRGVVENAKREASVTTKLVEGIEHAAEKLDDASEAADNYLQGVSEALAGVHEAFAMQLTSTLREGNSTFHDELSKAVDMLRGAIQDLGDTLDVLPTSR